MNCFIQQTDDTFKVAIDQHEPLTVSSLSQLALLVRKALGIDSGLRRFNVTVADYPFEMTYADTADGPLIRHTLGKLSPWLGPADLARSLEEGALMKGVHTDLSRGVLLSVEDISDRWRWSLSEASKAPEKWHALLSDVGSWTGLPSTTIGDELLRRLKVAGLPTGQPKEYVNAIASAISEGRPVLTREVSKH